jgi:hypothetical protein
MPEEQDSATPAETESGTLTGDAYQAEDVFENAEPWDPIETKIVLVSFVAALVFLVVLAYLIHKFILD